MGAATAFVSPPSRDETTGDPLAILRRLCALSSASHDRDGLERTAHALVDELTALGLDARVDDELVVTARTGYAPRLAVVGHYDTVLPAASARLDGDRFHATGAVDMKGGLAAFFAAVERLLRDGVRLPDLAIALVPDEEIGGPTGPAVVRRLGASCSELWVLEPGRAVGGLAADSETLVVGRWGLATWQLDARGVAAHSGVDFESGRSAVVAAARWIDRAHEATVESGRSSFNAARFTVPTPMPTATPDEAAPLNVVPTRAEVVGESRFADEATGARVLGELAALAQRLQASTGVELRFTVEERVRAFAAENVDRWWPTLHGFAAEVGLSLDSEPSRRGVSFSCFLPPGARPLVLDGLGPVGGGMHTREEWVSVRSLERRAALLTRLLRAGGVAASS